MRLLRQIHAVDSSFVNSNSPTTRIQTTNNEIQKHPWIRLDRCLAGRLRLRMKSNALRVVLVVAFWAGSHATRSAAETNLTVYPRFSHPRDITNLYLPLASLKQDVLENKSARTERTARP